MKPKLKLIATSPLCGQFLVCPAVYQATDGSLVVQGKRVDPASKGGITIPKDEEVVAIPRALLLKAAGRFKKSRARSG